MAYSKAMQLVHKSIDCMVSAIELYNKPDFKYREEAFSIMAVNAWELLLKAKIVKDNDNKLNSIYIREVIKKKDGKSSNKWKWKESRSGNKYTVEIIGAARKLLNKKVIDEICCANIELLVEIRDNSVHFYNKDKLLAQKIQEISTASIKSYLTLIQDWFSINLGRYNFYLMPLSFFHPSELEPIFTESRDDAVSKLLQYIADKEKKFPSNPSSKHNISIIIETKIVKSSTLDAQKIKISSDKSAPEVRLSIEDVRKTHPLTYKELTSKMKARYKNFKENQKYHELRKILVAEQNCCLKYPLNPLNPEGKSMCFFSPEIFKEFDKHYTQK